MSEKPTLGKKKKKKKSHYVVKLAITNMQNQLDFEIKVAIDYCLHIVLGKSPMNEPPDQAFFSFTSIWCGLFDSLVSICMHPHTHVYGSFKSMFCHSGNNTSSLFILNVYITFFFFLNKCQICGLPPSTAFQMHNLKSFSRYSWREDREPKHKTAFGQPWLMWFILKKMNKFY